MAREREDKLKRECEERGETFHHESDWEMGGRYADDIRRAHDMAKIRKEKESKSEKAATENGRGNTRERNHR